MIFKIVLDLVRHHSPVLFGARTMWEYYECAIPRKRTKQIGLEYAGYASSRRSTRHDGKKYSITVCMTDVQVPSSKNVVDAKVCRCQVKTVPCKEKIQSHNVCYSKFTRYFE